jgi:hypothetical protein
MLTTSSHLKKGVEFTPETYFKSYRHVSNTYIYQTIGAVQHNLITFCIYLRAKRPIIKQAQTRERKKSNTHKRNAKQRNCIIYIIIRVLVIITRVHVWLICE